MTGIRVLDEDHVELLRSELELLQDLRHPGAHLFFYERDSNESLEPGRVLFHALGAWRISAAFHDLLWNPAILVPASQLLSGSVRFWHDQPFVKPPHLGAVVSLAPGLLVLDPRRAHGSPDLLDPCCLSLYLRIHISGFLGFSARGAV